MGNYRYLEDEAIADVAFIAEGSDPEDLFYEAAMATASLQTDLSKLQNTETRELVIAKPALDRLLKSLLDEILYYKDAELLFATDFDLNIIQDGEEYRLTGMLHGGIFNPEEHPMHNDLKAITWHDFSVEEKNDHWEAYVLIDI